MKDTIRRILKEEVEIPLFIKRRVSVEVLEKRFINSLDYAVEIFKNKKALDNDIYHFKILVITDLMDDIHPLFQKHYTKEGDVYDEIYHDLMDFLLNYFEKKMENKFESEFSKKKNLKENIKKVLSEGESIEPILHKLLNMLFDGFDDCYYDWAEYNCGMGVCCDPYAIGFVLPKSEYNDYLFLLVDYDNYDHNGDYPKEISDELPEVCYESPDVRNPNFNTIIFYGIFSEEIENYMGPEINWKSDLLKIINKKFHCNAENILII